MYGPEGVEPAQYLNKLGVTCFVLKHRLAREPGSPYKVEIHARQDMERAMRLVRSRAGEFGIDPHRVGVLGSRRAARPARSWPTATCPATRRRRTSVDRLDARADFFMSIYPGPLGYPKTVPPDAPPAFMLVSYDDEFHAKVIEDMIPEYRAPKVPIEVHILSAGGHGYNLGRRSNLAAVKDWPQRMADWMADRGLLKRSS